MSRDKSDRNFVLEQIHSDLDCQPKAENLSMQSNGLPGHRLSSRKSSRVRGEVLVLPSNFVPGVGFIREDFILVITTK